MDDLVITEQDLQNLFRPKESPPERPPSPAEQFPVTKPSPPPPVPPVSPAQQRYRSKPRRLTGALLTFGLTFFVAFFAINGSAYTSRLAYWWQSDIEAEEAKVKEEVLISDVAANLPADRLIVPKLAIEVPVVWNSPTDRLVEDLRSGVAHYAGTALPSAQHGNVFITGHSSYYPWDPGQYKTVFANLEKLVAGDYITLTTSEGKYVYRVFEAVVVGPKQVEVLSHSERPIVSLMTCVPVGTNLRRLIVKGELVKVRPLAVQNQ